MIMCESLFIQWLSGTFKIVSIQIEKARCTVPLLACWNRCSRVRYKLPQSYTKKFSWIIEEYTILSKCKCDVSYNLF